MRYLVLPFILLLGLLELILRTLGTIVALPVTLALFVDGRGHNLAAFLEANVCFEIAKKMAA